MAEAERRRQPRRQQVADQQLAARLHETRQGRDGRLARQVRMIGQHDDTDPPLPRTPCDKAARLRVSAWIPNSSSIRETHAAVSRAVRNSF